MLENVAKMIYAQLNIQLTQICLKMGVVNRQGTPFVECNNYC